MTDSAPKVRDRARIVRRAGARLVAATVDERADWLENAGAALRAAVQRRLEDLSGATGLSAPMVTWATRTTLDTIRHDAMKALVLDAQRAGEPIGMLSVVLAGNVFTAAVRAVFVPLLFGVPVLVKASSRETMFPAMLRDALLATDPELGAAVEVVVFEGGDLKAEAALVEDADAVSVYGSDETVEAIRRRLPHAPLMAHGHGVSMAYCGAGALGSAAIEDTVARLALDVAAYDQRGCLSPQLILVEQVPDGSAEELARRLAEDGLRTMGTELPRGPLPPAIGAAQAQWRGVAEVEGTLASGADYAVAIRSALPIRWSPGYRNVTVSPVAGLGEAMTVIEPLGKNVKCIGTDRGSLADLIAYLDRADALAAYACPIGEMQTPPLDAPADGQPVWAGLTRR